MTPLAAQVADELGAIAERLAPLLGLDIADIVHERITSRAPFIAAQLEAGEPREAAGVVVDLGCALWPHGEPDPAWWRTPLGFACAASLRGDSSVTHAAAAEILGVHIGTVSTLVSRGTLERHPDGRISRASVLARLVRLRGIG